MHLSILAHLHAPLDEGLVSANSMQIPFFKNKHTQTVCSEVGPVQLAAPALSAWSSDRFRHVSRPPQLTMTSGTSMARATWLHRMGAAPLDSPGPATDSWWLNWTST